MQECIVTFDRNTIFDAVTFGTAIGSLFSISVVSLFISIVQFARKKALEDQAK